MLSKRKSSAYTHTHPHTCGMQSMHTYYTVQFASSLASLLKTVIHRLYIYLSVKLIFYIKFKRMDIALDSHSKGVIVSKNWNMSSL